VKSGRKKTNLLKLLSTFLDCGELDVEVLIKIDSDILVEAVDRLKENGRTINFPTLFREAVMVAAEKYGIDDEISEIDANYMDAGVYVLSDRAYNILNKHGFPVIREG